MSTLSVVLLVVIALISVAQAVLLFRFTMESRRAMRGLEHLADRLVRDLAPVAEDAAHAAQNAAEISQLAVDEGQRIDGIVMEATTALGRFTERVYDSVVPTLGRLATAAAFWRLFRTGFGLYRRLSR